MEHMTLQELSDAIGAKADRLQGERPVSGICTDTRALEPDENGGAPLFLALRGERFDGHDFLEKAYERGAEGVISEQPLPGRENVLVVPDTGRALLDAAAFYRERFRVFLVGVTGSVGKTSTKEMIYAILSAKGKTLKTEGNHNNQIGMPLTLFRLDSGYSSAVMEMGMSNFGEISELSRVCKPAVGVITNIGVSHMETLGSRENILKAKLEITDGMPHDAPLILNADNDLLSRVSLDLERPVIYYGVDAHADVTAGDIVQQENGTGFTIHYYGRSIPAWVPAVGRHNVYNALAGFCVGMVADMQPEEIVRALRLYKNSGMRQNITQRGGITVIEDCYNASPDSMRSAVDVLENVPCSGRRICVLGDMLELGKISEQAHLDVGRMVALSRVDMLLCFGELARDIKRGAMMAGMKNVRHFTEKAELSECLTKTLIGGDAVIYKASRGIGLEDAVVPPRRAEELQS